MVKRYRNPVLIAGLAGIGLGLGLGTAYAQTSPGDPNQQQARTIVDVTGYYLMTGFGGDPAFGLISPITGVGIDPDSLSIIENSPDMEGGGIRFSVQRLLADSWFAGAQFTYFGTDDRVAAGNITDDNDAVHANLLDGSLADEGSLNGLFEDFLVDYAMETIDLEQRFGDLVLGRRITPGGPLSGFWQVGVRIADSDLDRDVVYQNLEGLADIDVATINLSSQMWGAGPTMGAGATLALTPNLALSASTSVSALFSRFDLSRRDSYLNLSSDTEIRDVSLDTQGIVPVFDASIELEARRGRYFGSIGYTVSAWLGGARTIAIAGYDDSIDEASRYTIRREDLVTHGVFARAGMQFGDDPGQWETSMLGEGPNNTIIDVTGYYLMTGFGGDPAFGSHALIVGAGIDPDSHSTVAQLPEMEGGGVRFSVRRLLGPSWFAGGQFTSFSTDDRATIGNITDNSDGVLANLLDGSLADDANLNGLFRVFEVDYAMETIDLEQRFGDLVVGQRITPGGPLSGFWQVGVRIADTDLDRDVVYQNLEGLADLDTATINLRSEMWGVGPTMGAGATLALTPGLALSASTSVSALFSRFDLSRQDAYFNMSQNDTEIRRVSIDTQGIVPVFDASIELEARRGRFFASVGYTASAWLGGARVISLAGFDDVNDTTSPYTIKREDLVTHGVFARAGMTFGGDTAGEQENSLFGEGPNGTIIDITGYYLMTGFGGDPAFGSMTPIVGAGLDTESLSEIENLPDMEGGGIRVSVRRLLGPAWFAGAQFTGFATDDRAAIGNIAIDTDAVHASLLDSSLADNANLNSQFEDFRVDYAMETIDLEQRFGDLVVGRRVTPAGRWSGFWQVGVRVADTDLDRVVVYQNLEGVNDIDTATINLNSQMWGVGPTAGAGATLTLTPGLALSASTSVSALFSRFDLSRRDSYFNMSQNDTEIRSVSLDTQGVVPVFDASIELEAKRGRYFASIGYTVSAWLGGARAISINGFDDVNDLASIYTIRRDDLITHGIFARLGMTFGSTE